MNSPHLPVYILMVLLIFAVTIPLYMKAYGRWFNILMMSVLSGTAGLAILELLKVSREGAYSYTFGNYEAGIGIQFLVDDFSALMTFIVLLLGLLIVLFSLKDLDHEIEAENKYRYYTLVFLMLFSIKYETVIR